jgi:S1-C subfamily serine protease
VSTGILSALAGLKDDVRYIQISAPVQPGTSGGPLLDNNGHVVGVVVAKLDALKMAELTGDVPQNINFAVHWTELKDFLDENAIQYRRAPSVRPVQQCGFGIANLRTTRLHGVIGFECPRN